MLLLWLVEADVRSSLLPGSEQPPARACPEELFAKKRVHGFQKKREGKALGP